MKMFPNARLAKLNQHRGDPRFDRAMAEIEAATEEGLSSFEVNVVNMDFEMQTDLIVALEVMDYVVDTPQDGEVTYLEVSLG